MKKSNQIIRLIFSILLLSCAGVRQSGVEVIRLKGSDTMLLLTTRWAEEYMKQHPTVSIYVDGGGSGEGFKNLIDGEIQICASSRPIQAQEARQLAEKFGKIGMQFLVAKDALSIYLNPENPVRDLSLLQLKAIFTGQITHWKDVGGIDAPIEVIIRSPNSGTFQYFKEHVLDGESYTSHAQTISTTSSIVKKISENRNAIGYGGIAYGEELVHCKINQTAPTEENVHGDTYPIIRYLYLYTIDTPRSEVKSFIEWILKEGQDIVKKVGYFPIWEIPF